MNKDLVVDTRESWGNWIHRQLNFEDPPLVPREELPAERQPHRSFYGKMSCFMNGMDPYPEELRKNGRRNTMPIENPIDGSETSVT